MNILTLRELSVAFGHHKLLDRTDLTLVAGERVCLVGRNGTGKSTLFRVITGAIDPDDGTVWHRDTLRVSHLEQDVPADTPATIYQMVAQGIGPVGELLTEYHEKAANIQPSDEAALACLADIQHQLEAKSGWSIGQRIDTVLSRLELPADKRFSDCSGGVRRRVMLAKALVYEPDLLLLDEPTNHMDIAAIGWLEEYLTSFNGTLMFITHDRTFVQNLATRVVELDRGVLTSFPGDFSNYLRRKDEMLDAECRANELFDKRLAEHEAWIRQGVKARRTRNQGRVRKLQAMRAERQQRMSGPGSVNLSVDSGELSGKLVADLRHVSFSYPGNCLVHDFSTRILRGDRIGIVGPNGAGKSTLLRLILGELKPANGDVILGTRLETAYFDQQRSQLDPLKTVRDNISAGSDFVSVRGRSRHVISYLKDFLFPPQRVDSPVSTLSGGERNRLLLAKIFTESANMMVLDEPTNDLDVDTLELLEELLGDYDGTLLIVSHDRTFLNNVVTSTLVLEGDGKIGEYVGGYDDWLRQSGGPLQAKLSSELAPKTGAAGSRSKPQYGGEQKPKLSYKERRELESLPEKIGKLEAEQAEIEQVAGQPEFYDQDREGIRDVLERLERLHRELESAYSRWEYLDGIES